MKTSPQIHYISQQNQTINKNMMQAMTACTQLMAEGFTVLSVNVESATPIINIQPSDHCTKLNASLHPKIEHGQRSYQCKAPLAGCTITWEQRH